MEFSIIGALIAGLVGTAIMSAMMKMAGAAGMTRMPPMELVTGAMMTGDAQRARRIGTMIHWIVMGTVVFGLAYAGLFVALGSASWVNGLVIGAAHGVLVGLVFLPMMPTVHPRMGDASVPQDPVEISGGTVRLGAPGMFGTHWGGMTPMGLLLGHALYGVVVALVYGLFV